MGPLKISCSGECRTSARAERGIVSIAISLSGPAQGPVSSTVIAISNTVQAQLQSLSLADAVTGEASPDAPVTHWSMASLATGSYQPSDKDEQPLARVYTATTRLEVTFRDFAVLAAVASELATTELISVEGIEWRLTEETKAELARQCRRGAVKDAMMKAQDYADAAGKSDYEILEITDVGVEGGWDGPRMMSRSRDVAEVLNFEPAEVEVSAKVSARFDAA